jgi:CRISPR-associated protein (TIGR03986 family)
MATGRIAEWSGDKGYIIDENNKKFSLHKSQWKGQLAEIKQGVTVKFDIGTNKKGEYAVNAKLFDENKPTMTTTPHKPHSAHKTAQFNTFPKEGKPAETNKFPNPYHFINLDIQNAVIDEPVWHDGENSQDLLSGEMCFTLTALTPLLVGQWQYKAKEVTDNEENDEDKKCSLDFFDSEVKCKKAILEPLRLPSGRVVLSGTSLKGMLRNSLSGLLSPPMERVAERSYSYRPNANFQQDERFRKVRPALITEVKDNIIKVKVLKNARSAWFGHASDLGNPKIDGIAKAWSNIIKEPRKPKFKNGEKERDEHGNIKFLPQKYRFIHKNKAKKDDVIESIGKCYFAHYVGGIDGKAILCRLFDGNAGVYDAVLIQEAEHNYNEQQEFSIPIKDYQPTLDHLQDTKGLLASGYPNGKEADYKKARDVISKLKFIEGQLIYVELEGDKINSFGHHYYYRWRYANTIRTVGDKNVRPILKPLDSELAFDDKGKPKKLSAARLLFGYTSHNEDLEKSPLKQDGSANIGKGGYQRLAGRIHINSAVEFIQNGSDNQRFLTGDKALALQPLGQPRPSSVEHYLQQPPTDEKLQQYRKDGGKMLTYGDLTTAERDTAGALAGRKFYVHQPDAAKKDESCYQAEKDAEYIQSQQAMLVRFVSKPDTIFKFRLQFKDLRLWELGALFVTVEPEKHLATVLEQLTNKLPEQKNDLQTLLNEIKKHPTSSHKNSPLFAHKLGHARPLGFGSVLLKCDKLKLLDTENNLPKFNEDDSKTNTAVTAFADKLADVINQSKSIEFLKQWCAIHQYAGRTRAAYQKLDGETLKFHSTARSNHIKARRLSKEQARRSEQLLAPLKFEI